MSSTTYKWHKNIHEVESRPYPYITAARAHISSTKDDKLGLNGNPSRVERLTHGIDMKLSIVRLAVLASAAL